MSRLRGLPPDQLDDEQRMLYEEIVASRSVGGSFALVDTHGALTGPFNAMVHNPALGRSWSALGAQLRFESTLEQRLVELAICTVGAHFRADFEFHAHAPLALQAGVRPDVIDALRRGDPPLFDRHDERVVHDLTVRLVRAEQIPERVYGDARSTLGEAALVEVASLVGYYAALAMSLNLFAVTGPPGSAPLWGPPA